MNNISIKIIVKDNENVEFNVPSSTEYLFFMIPKLSSEIQIY